MKCKHCGHDTTSKVTFSVVVDEPGRPVAAPCLFEGCHYKDLEDLVRMVALLKREERVRAYQLKDATEMLVDAEQRVRDLLAALEEEQERKVAVQKAYNELKFRMEGLEK